MVISVTGLHPHAVQSFCLPGVANRKKAGRGGQPQQQADVRFILSGSCTLKYVWMTSVFFFLLALYALFDLLGLLQSAGEDDSS